jgi:hypothetical protein
MLVCNAYDASFRVTSDSLILLQDDAWKEETQINVNTN